MKRVAKQVWNKTSFLVSSYNTTFKGFFVMLKELGGLSFFQVCRECSMSLVGLLYFKFRSFYSYYVDMVNL
jgi:hypothetical protein